jgi:hypothetical protein
MDFVSSKTKKPVNPMICRLSISFENEFVESPGIEPGSKQATKELSTRLFSEWIFVSELGQKQPLFAYLL